MSARAISRIAAPVDGLMTVNALIGRLPPRGERAGLCDEIGEEPPILGVLLGVPLDADDVAGRGVDEGLHESVVGVRRRHETVAEATDALVVVAVHAHLGLADDLGERSVGRHLDVVLGEDAAADAVLLGAERFGQMLLQGAAAGDVHELQTAADREHRDATALRRPEQGELPCITVDAGGVGERMPVLAVQFGGHISTAREHEAVHARDGRIRGIRILRRQEQRDAADGGHAREVLLRQE